MYGGIDFVPRSQKSSDKLVQVYKAQFKQVMGDDNDTVPGLLHLIAMYISLGQGGCNEMRPLLLRQMASYSKDDIKKNFKARLQSDALEALIYGVFGRRHKLELFAIGDNTAAVISQALGIDKASLPKITPRQRATIYNKINRKFIPQDFEAYLQQKRDAFITDLLDGTNTSPCSQVTFFNFFKDISHIKSSGETEGSVDVWLGNATLMCNSFAGYHIDQVRKFLGCFVEEWMNSTVWPQSFLKDLYNMVDHVDECLLLTLDWEVTREGFFEPEGEGKGEEEEEEV